MPTQIAVKMAVVGPFSSGKSALINALVGESVVPMGVTPLTAVLHRFRWSETRRIEVERQNGRVDEVEASELGALTGTGSNAAAVREVRLHLPAGCLKDVEIWDTPGFGSNSLAHEVVARKALLEADVILWVTPIDHALDRGEAEKLARLRSADTPVVLVVNKADLAESEAERDEAVAEIAGDAGSLARAVVWLSARLGLQAGTDADLREKSGLARLEPLLAELFVARMKAVRDRPVARPLGPGEVVCPTCDTVAQFDDRFCVCGRALADQHRACPRCAADNATSRPRCRGCNLPFAAWERGETLARQAEEEIGHGLFVDALASLALALEEEPGAPGREARRAEVLGVVEGIDALFRRAARTERAEAAVAEWARALALHRTVARPSDVFLRRLAATIADWAAPPRGAFDVAAATRFAQEQGARSAELARLAEAARRELAVDRLRAREAFARASGIAIAPVDGDAPLDAIASAIADIDGRIAQHEAAQAAARAAEEARTRSEAEARRAASRAAKVKREAAQSAEETERLSAADVWVVPSSPVPPAFAGELARIGNSRLATTEIVVLATLLADGSASALTPQFMEAWNRARSLPAFKRFPQVEWLGQYPKLWEAGKILWLNLGVFSPPTDPFAWKGAVPPGAICPPTAAAAAESGLPAAVALVAVESARPAAAAAAAAEPGPLVGEDVRTTFGLIGAAIGFFLGLGAGGIGALPGAAVGGMLGYYLPEVGGCVLVAVVVGGVLLVMVLSSL